MLVYLCVNTLCVIVREYLRMEKGQIYLLEREGKEAPVLSRPFCFVGCGEGHHGTINNTKECVTLNPFIINVRPHNLNISQWAPPWRVLHVFLGGAHSDQFFTLKP